MFFAQVIINIVHLEFEHFCSVELGNCKLEIYESDGVLYLYSWQETKVTKEKIS